ncbi:MAG: DUF1344 domain-containing protein [Rhizobiaceae bacterium]
MRKILAAVTILGSFGMAAYAAEVQGSVSGVDQETRTILLDDGTSYVAAESIDLSAIEAGATVRITYDDTTMQAT